MRSDTGISGYAVAETPRMRRDDEWDPGFCAHDYRREKRRQVVDELVPLLRRNGGSMQISDAARAIGCTTLWLVQLAKAAPRTVRVRKSDGLFAEGCKAGNSMVELHMDLMR